MSTNEPSRTSELDLGPQSFLHYGVGQVGVKIAGCDIRGPLSVVPGLAESKKSIVAKLNQRQSERGYRITRNVFRKTTAATVAPQNGIRADHDVTAVNEGNMLRWWCECKSNPGLFVPVMAIWCSNLHPASSKSR